MTSHSLAARSTLRGRWPAAAACALAGAAVYQFFGNANRGYIDTASLFHWWGYQWVNAASDMRHSWIILALSGWLFWRNLRVEGGGGRREAGGMGRVGLKPEIWNLSFAGAAMSGGLLLHLLGFAVQQARVSIVALLLFAWGVLALAGGRRWRRASAFPLAFLFFAIPLDVLDSVGFWLRLWVVKASYGLAHAAGIGVLQSGTQLLAPDGRFQYDVAAACSGVRSLMALAALSLVVGYLYFRPWWLRTTVFLLCFPLVYLGNVARITAIIFAAQWGGQAWGEWVHEWLGFIVFVIVFGGLLAAVAILQRMTGGGAAPAAEAITPSPSDETLARSAPTTSAAIAVTGLIVLLAGTEMFALARLAALPPRGTAGVRLTADGKNPADLPTFLGSEWIGRRVDVTAVEREILPPDTGFSRKLYVPVDDPTRAVFLSIVLSGRDRTSIHRPELCLVGQGWTLRGATVQHFIYPGRGAGVFPATMLRVQREVMTAGGRETIPQLVAYWFVSGDEVVATHWQRLLHDGWNRLRHLRADRWAYVLMQTDARDGESAALARMQTVLDQVLPAFQAPVGGAR